MKSFQLWKIDINSATSLSSSHRDYFGDRTSSDIYVYLHVSILLNKETHIVILVFLQIIAFVL